MYVLDDTKKKNTGFKNEIGGGGDLRYGLTRA